MLSDELVAEGRRLLPSLAREMRGQLDVSSEQAYRDFFLSSGQRTDIPKRSAYYLGLRVAEDVARVTRRSPAELARLRGAELRSLVDGALLRFSERNSESR